MRNVGRWAAVCLFIGGFPLQAQEVGSSFLQGRTRFSVTGGYASSNNKSDGVLGIGAGYYLLDGLEAGLDGEAWLGSKPHIYTVSPETRYIMTQFETIRPYLGGFYKRTFYDTLPNQDSVGGRAGLISTLSPHAYLTAGAVYEQYLNCDTAIYTTCSQVYPEIGISF